MRLPFDSVFRSESDGSLTLMLPIRVGGITLAAGNKLSTGQTIGGIDFTRYKGKEIEADVEDNIYVIKAIY
jgi:hypothetical protein